MGKRSSRYRLASIILVKLALVALLLVSAAVLVGLRHAVRSHR